jgi:hypothetical protein
MRMIDHEQGTAEWLQSRLGCPSGSGFANLITATGKPSTSADSYINQLVAELLTGQPTEFKVNEWMQRGTDLEPVAREYYEMASGKSVVEVGFCKHDKLECGISPDGLVGTNGGLEIKCPAPHTHVAYLRDGGVPTKYKQQVMGCLWITEREWWDFVSYHEQMPVLQVRVYRDEDYITKLAAEVEKACEAIQYETERLRNMQ